MYTELLDIVRSGNTSEAHTDATEVTAVTSQLPDLDTEREDIDDEEIEALLNQQKKPSNEFTFVGQNVDLNFSKLQGIEEVRAFLEKNLGEDVLMKAYPILLSFGD